MNWYLPITIIPAIGLLILSTITQMLSLILYIGTLFVFVAITLLIIYAFRAVKIRKDQFANTQINDAENQIE